MSKFDLSLNKDNSANIETTPEYIDMDKLSLSAPLEFLAKYDSPREWILEQEEAERVKTFTEPFNIKVDALEKAEYGVGEALYNLGRSPAELSQLGLGLASGAGKLVFPHSTDTALDRLYKNIALNNAKNREERESIVTAYTGGDSDIVKWTEGIAELGIMLGTAGAAAGMGASAARRGISKLATETAKGVATRPSVVRRASSIAAARGAKAGQVAATIGTTFAQEAGAPTTEKVRQYIAKTGDTQLKNYNPFEDSLTSLAVGAINSAIEVGFGVERFIPEFWGTGTNFNRAARRFVEGFLGEGAEEFSQSVVSQLGDIINGYKDNIDWWEAFDNAIVGGVLGGSAGFGMYHLNRIRMARQLSNDYNIPYKKAAEFVDDMLGTGIERTTNELSARAELKNENGSAWNKMVTGVKTAMSTVNFGDEQSRDNQATLFARTNAQIAMRLARESGLSTDEFLDIAEFSAMNNGDNLNMIFIKPLGTVADIERRIAEQDAVITRERELKKTGAGDNKVLQEARMRKNILQKAKAIKEFQNRRLQEQIATQTTPELKTEIDTAKEDAESLGDIESFNEKNPEATTSEKVKRYGNAVIKKLFGKDTKGFNAVMVLPEATNAKNAIITVADRINNFIKAHRTYGLKADLVNALNKLQIVTQENFIDNISYPALDGVDVTAENAFLYHFLFSDETTISKFLVSYITRAEQSLSGETNVPLSKKDLVGQAFKATDDMMQTQAQLTNTEYQSIYDTTGNIVDKNVLAVMLSYQNQFVQEQGQQIPPQMLEQFDLADENARLDDIYPEYTGETIEVDGKERTVYNSNGDRIAKSKEALTNFWRWFGDSKVVDNQGRPLVVYHGSRTEKNFDTFDKRHQINKQSRTGFWFGSESIDYGKNVRDFYLKLENPFIYDAKKQNYYEIKENDKTLLKNILSSVFGEKVAISENETIISDYLTKYAEKQGYDGVIIKDIKEGNNGLLMDDYVAFDSTQIKSVDNRGTYSADTGNIYYQDDISDKTLVATHAIKKQGMKEALRLGGFAMPSLAIQKNIDNSYGEIIFVAPASMAQPSKETRVYDRDAWTPMINFIEYERKPGFYEEVERILEQNNADPKRASTYVMNIETSAREGVPTWNVMAEELFGIYKGYDVSEVDMRHEISNNGSLEKEYEEWYYDFIIPNLKPRIFRGFTQMGNRRYADVTLDNLVRELKTQPEHRDMTSDMYFFHDVMRELVTRFKTISDLKQEQDRLVDRNEVDARVNELNSEYNALATELRTDESNHIPEIALAEALIEQRGSMSDRLESVGLKHDVSSVKKVNNLVKKIKKVPVKYFEGKVRRAVRFNEFSGVFVPVSESYNNIAKQLQEQGANVIRYDSSSDLDNKFNQLVQQDSGILFQGKKANGFYDPELGVIVLGRNMNEMTLPHEMQHYWLDKIFSIYKRAKSGELQVKDGWMESTKDLLNMLGVDENQAQLTRPQQEKFARMSEAYLTGIGISGDQNQTFREYLSWIPEKYKSILQLGYINDKGMAEYPVLDDAAVEFFNKWYANPSLPTLPTSPERQRFINPTDDKGEVSKVSIKEMNNREKEFGQDAEEQAKTDQRFYNVLDENMPSDIKSEADGQKVVQASRSNFLKESENQQRRWYERKSRDAEAQKAQEYIENNPDHAKEIVYGDPELIPNDSGVDRATLINAYIATQDIKVGSDDWAKLQTNIAINQSLAGTQLALSNNKSYRTYLDALREVEQARELKAATNYAGAKEGALEKFNADIKAFVERELPRILGTTPDSQERELAIKSMFERARTTFSGNTTGSVLNQEDFNFAKRQKGMSQAFVTWAVNQIKKDAGAKLKPAEQAKLLEISAKAQQAQIDLDNPDAGKAVAAAQEIRKWQLEKQKLMGVSPEKFSLMGDYAPRAMLASFNTLVVANIPSTAINTGLTNLIRRGVFGADNVSDNLKTNEIRRIKAIYNATSMNLAQMEKPTSPSLLHGEKYSASGQKWYDPFTILGREDNWFRVPTFVNTLARIASTDAKKSGRNADEVFKEYCKLSNQTDEAKLARKQALAVANMAVFTQDGVVSRTLNHIRSEINKLTRGLVGLPEEGFGVGNLIAPFLKTGANIAEMGIRGSLAPVTTITALIKSWRTGAAINPMTKLALGMDWAYFMLSAGSMVLLAALTSDDDDFYAEPYEPGKKYDPNKPYDSINIGGVWIDLDLFGPFAIPMRVACKFIQNWEKDKGIIDSLGQAYGKGAKFAAMDTPLVESLFSNQISYAVRKPEDYALGWGYNQLNKLVPAQLKPISRAVSRGQGWTLDTGFAGKVLSRKFNRNYGFDGLELTTQDWVDIFSTRFTVE